MFDSDLFMISLLHSFLNHYIQNFPSGSVVYDQLVFIRGAYARDKL